MNFGSRNMPGNIVHTLYASCYVVGILYLILCHCARAVTIAIYGFNFLTRCPAIVFLLNDDHDIKLRRTIADDCARLYGPARHEIHSLFHSRFYLILLYNFVGRPTSDPAIHIRMKIIKKERKKTGKIVKSFVAYIL